MPVQDFLLTPTGDQRLQVHWPARKDPTSAVAGENAPQEKATLMINRSIFGSLDTFEERTAGKDFYMPDGALLHVQFFDDKPYAWINGQPLAPVAGSAEIKETTSINPANRSRGGCMTAWMILGIIGASISLIAYLLAFLGSFVTNKTNVPSFIWLLFALISIGGIVGYSLLLGWKKLGFYLVLGYVVAGFLLAIPFGLWDYRSIAPIIVLGIFYFWMQRTNVWDYLT
ncbi:MAG TPA: hypothetical protein VFN23_16210 [Ktedonobacteraceae bacterium]|nr:hypothetical protein [Ktedonobacteraceae bacterium]